MVLNIGALRIRIGFLGGGGVDSTIVMIRNTEIVLVIILAPMLPRQSRIISPSVMGDVAAVALCTLYLSIQAANP